MDQLDDVLISDPPVLSEIYNQGVMSNSDRNISEKILDAQIAIALWKKGKKAWNEWAEEHAGWAVDFAGIDFGKLRGDSKAPISFEGFVFPGPVDFAFARFGSGGVSFYHAEFFDGDLSFLCTEFDDGDVSFLRTQFGKGNVSFCDARFGRGIIAFTGAQFGAGEVSFNDVQFGDGDINFRSVVFGNGKVTFNDAQFGDGDITFNDALFGQGGVDFNRVHFGSGDVHFDKVTFGEGDVEFEKAQFGEGNLSFINARFSEGVLHFTPKDIMQCRSINFSGAKFESNVNLSTLNTKTVVNFCHTNLKFPIDLDNTRINYRRSLKWVVFEQAVDPNDSTSFRRLKILAKEAGDNERALDFFAKEMRCAYWHNIRGLKLSLYYLYDWLSDYGRSILRPVIALLICWILFAGAYAGISWKKVDQSSMESALLLSAGHVIPYYVGAKDDRKQGKEGLYGDWPMPVQVRSLTLTQSVLSVMLSFLIGLGLRNRFRQ